MLSTYRTGTYKYCVIKKICMNLDEARKHMLMQITKLEDTTNEAFENAMIYKAKMKNTSR